MNTPEVDSNLRELQEAHEALKQSRLKATKGLPRRVESASQSALEMERRELAILLKRFEILWERDGALLPVVEHLVTALEALSAVIAWKDQK